jgi:hypothetical protein
LGVIGSHDSVVGQNSFAQIYCGKSRGMWKRALMNSSTTITVTIYFWALDSYTQYQWDLVTMAWRGSRLRMEERPRIWTVAANILNKQTRAADKGWSSSLGVGRGANNPSL